MFCPQCRSEFVPGVEECVDCEVALVNEAPPGPTITDGSEWAELMQVTDEHEAELLRGYLESEGVPCHLESLVFHAEPFTFGPLSKVRVHVSADRVADARQLVNAREERPASVDNEGPAG